MKKTITTLLLTLTMNAHANNVLRGHIPKNIPIMAYAESPRENPVYKIDSLFVIVDSDFMNSYPFKHIVLNGYVMGKTFDDHRKKYKYQLIIQGYQKLPAFDRYRSIEGHFKDAKYGFYEFENGNEKDFIVSHDLVTHEKGEQFSITPVHDIAVTVLMEDFN